MFDTLKNIAVATAKVAGSVATVATGVTIGILAAAKVTEMLTKSDS